MAGLILGGGYGPLMPRIGLACDNLISAEVVLPSGEVLVCDAGTNADLFWALRGGGGNFGVITFARLCLHEVGTVLAGTIIFPWERATRGPRPLRRPDVLRTVGVVRCDGPLGRAGWQTGGGDLAHLDGRSGARPGNHREDWGCRHPAAHSGSVSLDALMIQNCSSLLCEPKRTSLSGSLPRNHL
jgi:FAD/FMN-containing dehydrogenase